MSFESAAEADLGAAVAFVEKAAPTLATELVTEFKNAVTTVKNAVVPVGDAAVVAAVDLVTSRYALNAPFSATEIAFLEGVIAKLQALLPAA